MFRSFYIYVYLHEIVKPKPKWFKDIDIAAKQAAESWENEEEQQPLRTDRRSCMVAEFRELYGETMEWPKKILTF